MATHRYTMSALKRSGRRYAVWLTDARVVQLLQLEDRMTSFFLAETCKYLYLLFDDDNFAHGDDYVFTTEGTSVGRSVC